MQIIELRSSAIPRSNDAGAVPGDVWIDIHASEGDGRSWLAQESGLDDAIIARLIEPARVTHWRQFGRGLHFNMYAAAPGEDDSTITMVSFGIWLEPGRIISIRHGRVPVLDAVVAACSAGQGPASTGELLVMLLSAGLNRVEESLHAMVAVIDQLEDQVLTGKGPPSLDRVAELQRRLVYARRFRLSLANMLAFIAAQPDAAHDAALREAIEGITNVVAQNQDLLDWSIERASALRDQIRDQMADSLSAATYRFTWVATVFLPLTFITGLLGINVAGVPGEHDPVAFWMVCGALCVIATLWGIVVGRATHPFAWRGRASDPTRAEAGGSRTDAEEAEG